MLASRVVAHWALKEARLEAFLRGLRPSVSKLFYQIGNRIPLYSEIRLIFNKK